MASESARWRSYDGVAEAYAGTVMSGHFGVARDLISLVGVEPGARVLDVGTGTGTVATAALTATGGAAVIGIDPSIPMLSRIQPRPPLLVAAAVAGALPFPGPCFDVVVASLVLNHVPDYHRALAEMARVLRSSGRIGVTAWGRTDDTPVVADPHGQAAYECWTNAASPHVPVEELDRAMTEVLPWEAWFSDPVRLAAAVEEAGLCDIRIEGRVYRAPSSHEDWLAAVNTGSKARYLRHEIGDQVWQAFCLDVLHHMESRVPDPFDRVFQMLLAVGTKS